MFLAIIGNSLQHIADLPSEVKDEFQPKFRLFRVLRPGGIKLYIPKILVIGSFDDGKSSRDHTLYNRNIPLDRIGITIPLDHNYNIHCCKGFCANIEWMKNGLDSKCLFENKLFREKIIGIFLTVDSTSFRDLFRAKIELKNIMKYGFPYILIANKQDLPTALSIDEIRNQLNVPEDLPIVPTEAIKMQGFFKAFDLLLEMNLRQYHR